MNKFLNINKGLLITAGMICFAIGASTLDGDYIISLKLIGISLICFGGAGICKMLKRLP